MDRTLDHRQELGGGGLRVGDAQYPVPVLFAQIGRQGGGAALRPEPVEHLAQLGKPDRLGGHHPEDGQRLRRGDQRQEPAPIFAQNPVQRTAGQLGRRLGADDAGADVLHDRAEERLLAGEITVHRALRDPGAPGDGVHADRAVSGVQEQPRGRLDDGAPLGRRRGLARRGAAFIPSFQQLDHVFT